MVFGKFYAFPNWLNCMPMTVWISKITDICILWVKIFQCFMELNISPSVCPSMLHFGRFQWGLRGYIQNVGVQDNSRNYYYYYYYCYYHYYYCYYYHCYYYYYFSHSIVFAPCTLFDWNCTLLNWNQWSVYHVYRYLRLIWLVTIKPILVWNWIDECHFPCYYIKRYMSLTHWGRDKMDPITQTTFSRAFSWMNMFEFRLKFHWGLFPRVQLTIFQHWFR